MVRGRASDAASIGRIPFQTRLIGNARSLIDLRNFVSWFTSFTVEFSPIDAVIGITQSTRSESSWIPIVSTA